MSSTTNSTRLNNSEVAELVTGHAQQFKQYVRRLNKRFQRITEAMVNERNEVRDKANYKAVTVADYRELVGNDLKPITEVNNYTSAAIAEAGAMRLKPGMPGNLKQTHYMRLNEFGQATVARMANLIDEYINAQYGNDQWKNQAGGQTLGNFLDYFKNPDEYITKAYVDKLIDTFITIFGVIRADEDSEKSVFYGYNEKGKALYTSHLMQRAVPIFLVADVDFDFDPITTVLQRGSVKSAIGRSLGVVEKAKVPMNTDNFIEVKDAMEGTKKGGKKAEEDMTVLEYIKKYLTLNKVIDVIESKTFAEEVVNAYQESELSEADKVDLPKRQTIA